MKEPSVKNQQYCDTTSGEVSVHIRYVAYSSNVTLVWKRFRKTENANNDVTLNQGTSVGKSKNS